MYKTDTPNIFISYSWVNTNTADEIDNDFKNFGIIFKRDIRDAPYRTVIRDYMNTISKADYVVMLISDEFLKSKNCMYEVSELLNSHTFNDRILPVLLGNANSIFNAEQRIEYYSFWKSELDKANDRMRIHPNVDTIKEVTYFNNINTNIPYFLQKITELNVISFVDLKKENYKSVLNIIGISESNLFNQLLEIDKIVDLNSREMQFQDFVNLNPTYKYGLFSIAHLAQLLNNPTKAKLYYERALNIDPQDAVFHNNLGVLLENHYRDYKGSKYHLEQAILINPNYSEAYLNLGNLLKVIGQVQDAKETYQEAISIDPQNTMAYFNLGILLNILNSPIEAIEYLNQAISLDPNCAEAYNEIGLSYLNIKNYSLATERFNQAIALKDNYADPYYNLAILNKEVRNYNEVKTLYKKGISITPYDKNAQFNIGNIFRELEEFKEAKIYYQQAIALDHKYFKAHANLAVVHEILQEYDEALYHYNEAVDISNEDSAIHWNLARLLRKINKYEDATKHYNIAVSINPDLKLIPIN